MKVRLQKKLRFKNKVCMLFVRDGENFDCSNTCKP